MMNAIIPSGTGDHVGLAVVRSLGRRSIPTTIVSREKRSMPCYSRYCTQKRICEYDDEFFSELTEEDIIMPNGEDEMLLFAKHAPLYDYTPAFPDYATLVGLYDKSSLMRRAMNHHIQVPETFFVDGPDHLVEISGSLPYPLVVKPNRGRGGRGVIRVDHPDLIEESYASILRQYGPAILQECIPFTERFSAAVLTDKNFRIQRICIIQEIRTYPLRSGPGCYVRTVTNDEIRDLTFEIMKVLKIWGVTELDFIIDERDGRPKLLEINPRFWGSLQCAVSAGVDFPFLLYEIATDKEVSPSFDYQTGITGRNVVCNDLRHLLMVLRSRFPVAYKMKTMSEFVKFHRDDAYFIFSLDDPVPFLSIFEYYLLKMADRARLNVSEK